MNTSPFNSLCAPLKLLCFERRLLLLLRVAVYLLIFFLIDPLSVVELVLVVLRYLVSLVKSDISALVVDLFASAMLKF